MGLPKGRSHTHSHTRDAHTQRSFARSFVCSLLTNSRFVWCVCCASSFLLVVWEIISLDTHHCSSLELSNPPPQQQSYSLCVSIVVNAPALHCTAHYDRRPSVTFISSNILTMLSL